MTSGYRLARTGPACGRIRPLHAHDAFTTDRPDSLSFNTISSAGAALEAGDRRKPGSLQKEDRAQPGYLFSMEMRPLADFPQSTLSNPRIVTEHFAPRMPRPADYSVRNKLATANTSRLASPTACLELLQQAETADESLLAGSAFYQPPRFSDADA